MDKDFKKLRRNLIRRANYFNKNNGGGLSIAEFLEIKTNKQLLQQTRKLKKARDEYEKSRSYFKLKTKSSKIKSVGKPKTIKVDNSAAFNKRVDKFVQDVRNYNRKLSAFENSKRFTFLPKNPTDLKKGREILNNLEWGNFEKAEKLLKVKKGDTIAKASAILDVKKAKATATETYKDRVFFQTSLKEAGNSPLPQLEDLFKSGGSQFVKDLAKNGFGIIEYVYRDDVDTAEDVIINKLWAVRKRLTKGNRSIVEKFIKTFKGV